MKKIDQTILDFWTQEEIKRVQEIETTIKALQKEKARIKNRINIRKFRSK